MTQKIGQFLSYILRHHPEEVGVSLDEHGWVEVDRLIQAVGEHGKYQLMLALLQDIVENNEKKRYSFSEDGLWIRANQGHSVDVDVELEEREPPSVLYHGTAKKFVESIQREGLVSKSRLYVHLSESVETASQVGRRHGELFLYEVNSRQMYEDGFRFFISVNGVWLTENVPVSYLLTYE